MEDSFKTVWKFNRTDYIERSPSRKDGFTYQKEKRIRTKTTQFILQVCYHLKLPQITIATATTYFHRFYMLNSLAKFDSKAVAGVCVFVACKAEETIRKMLDVAISCARVYFGDPTRLEKAEYEFWRSIIKMLEPVVCTSLCYDYSVEHPYRVYIKFMKILKGYNQDILRKLAEGGWSIINETYKAPLSLFYDSTIIASAALLISAKVAGIEFNDYGRINNGNHDYNDYNDEDDKEVNYNENDFAEGSVWWLLSHTDLETTTECVDDILGLYNFPETQNSISVINNPSSPITTTTTPIKEDKKISNYFDYDYDDDNYDRKSDYPKSSPSINKYGTPDFKNLDSCDVRFESIAEKLEPDVEPSRGLLDKNDDDIVEDDDEDEDGQIFEDDKDDNEYDGGGVNNGMMRENGNGGLDDDDDNNNYEIEVDENDREKIYLEIY